VYKSILALYVLILSLDIFASQTIQIDGKNLEFEVKGDGSVIVLFDAGAFTGMAGWDPLWNDLPDEITAYRFSRLGEGNSDKCVGQRSSEQHVEEVKSFLTTLQIDEPFVYVGHSLGGATARNFAHSFPDDVLGMLLVDPENPRDIEIIKEIDPINGPAEIEQIKNQDYELSEGRWCFLDAIWKKENAKDFADIGDIPVTLIATTMTYENPTTIFNSDIGRQRWGQIQQDWVKSFPQGRFVSTDKSGHFIQQNEPQLVLNELTKLIARIENPSQNYGINGKWNHSTKPVIIEFDLEANQASIFEHKTAGTAGLNILKNITAHSEKKNYWNGDMFDGYQGKYVNVSIVKHNNELSIYTDDGKEVLKLVRRVN